MGHREHEDSFLLVFCFVAPLLSWYVSSSGGAGGETFSHSLSSPFLRFPHNLLFVAVLGFWGIGANLGCFRFIGLGL